MSKSVFSPPDPPPELMRISALEMTSVQVTSVFAPMIYRNWTIYEQQSAESDQVLAAKNTLAYMRWLRSAPDAAEIAAAQQDSSS